MVLGIWSCASLNWVSGSTDIEFESIQVKAGLFKACVDVIGLESLSKCDDYTSSGPSKTFHDEGRRIFAYILVGVILSAAASLLGLLIFFVLAPNAGLTGPKPGFTPASAALSLSSLLASIFFSLAWTRFLSHVRNSQALQFALVPLHTDYAEYMVIICSALALASACTALIPLPALSPPSSYL